jgi:hypothetical protein
MKILNCDKCIFISKLNPFNLGIIAFFWILVPWWFCYRSTLFLMMNLKLFVKRFYEIENTSIFAWSSILGVGHYSCFYSLICRLPLNSLANYLVHTIWCIINFLQLKISLWHNLRSTCTCSSSLNLSITWIKTSFIMKSMLSFPPYHIIYFNRYVVSN